MKRPLLSGYTFFPSSKKIDFSGVAGFDGRRLFGIINLSDNKLIYDPGKSGFGGAMAGSALTLEFDTSDMLVSDALLVLYEDGDSASNSMLERLRLTLADAATSDRQDTGNGTLSSILAVLRTQRAETLWTDDTGGFFVRIDAGGTISWTDPSGNASPPPASASAGPADRVAAFVAASRYQATVAGAGFSVGDYLSHVVTADPQTGAVLGHFWLNVTTEAKLASGPASASISPIKPLPDGAATSAKQDTGNSSLASLDSKLPAPGQKAAAQSLSLVIASDDAAIGALAASAWTGSGSASLISLLKGIFFRSIGFADVASANIAAGGATAQVSHDAGGTTSPWAKFNAAFASNQPGTYMIQGSNDNFATGIIVDTGTLSANIAMVRSVPVMFRY